MKKISRKLSYVLFFLLMVFLFVGCAEVNPHVDMCLTSDPCGFLDGLLHGFIVPFSWIGSLFNDNIAIYAYDNNGAWYDFGFVLGISLYSHIIREV